MSNTSLTVVEAKGWQNQKRFLDLPEKIYKHNQYWVPQLRIEQKGLVGFNRLFIGRDPFYDNNDCQAFIALDGKKTVGRICAILNNGHLERYKDGVGFIGFFDCIADQSVADGLFDAASDWLRKKGCKIVRGPVNPSLNHTLGLLIDGFDSSPFFMMTYNLPYYESLFENYGFQKTQDLYAYWGKVEMLPKINGKLQPICDHIRERTGVITRALDTKHFQRDVELFLRIYNEALINTWGFVPMSEREVKEMAFFLKFMIVPELATAVELEGKTIGASFAMPDFNPRIRQIGGRLFPFGWYRLLRRKADIKSIRVLSTNVLPAYQMQGFGMLLLNAIVPKVMEAGITDAEFSWVLESNSFSRGSLEKSGAIRTKTYRVYDKSLSEGGS
ncbi:MAG: GNAT family N-acetyltransferase [Planctomycetaceae bacterium]|nr:GNAT family N-acetyltransferase [Planctomycetaceae bacterium]